VVVLSGLFAKTAYIYRDYAYRLCTQEAGLLTGNLDLVARSMGLRAQVHHQFVDEPVHKLLGLDRDEEPALVILPLRLAGADASTDAGAGAGADADPNAGADTGAGAVIRRGAVAVTAAALAATIEPIGPQVVRSGLQVARACPTLTAVNRASLRSTTADFAAAVPMAPALPGTRPLPLPGTAVPELDLDLDLAAVLRARDSGPGIFRPVASQVDGLELWARLARVRDGVVSDAVPAGAPVPLELFLTVGDLNGIPAGCYRLDQDTGALHPVVRADPDAGSSAPDALAAIERVTIPGPVFRNMNAVVHLVVDRDWAFDTFGDRGYRVINQEAGLLAHRVCIAAAAQGLSGRIVNAYHAEGVRTALGLTEQRHTPVFQILLARTGPGGRMIVPVEPEAVE
jgi:nitroreductase